MCVTTEPPRDYCTKSSFSFTLLSYIPNNRNLYYRSGKQAKKRVDLVRKEDVDSHKCFEERWFIPKVIIFFGKVAF